MDGRILYVIKASRLGLWRLDDIVKGSVPAGMRGDDMIDDVRVPLCTLGEEATRECRVVVECSPDQRLDDNRLGRYQEVLKSLTISAILISNSLPSDRYSCPALASYRKRQIEHRRPYSDCVRTFAMFLARILAPPYLTNPGMRLAMLLCQ